MDGDKPAADSTSGGGRDTLVEKAAKKLATLVSEPVPSEPDIPVVTRSSPQPPQPGNGERPSAADVAAPRREQRRPVDQPKAPARRSRQADLDFARLAELGILTPDGLRTTTTEEFRLIKRTVLTKRWEEDTKNSNLIMVTSAAPGEGKTFVSINLAMSIASERDYRVLLVDADLSRPNVPQTLGIEVDRGLIDVLTDDSLDLADVLIRTNVEGLTVLPAGRHHRLSTELLASQGMARFVGEVARRYPDRIIIFDSPPVLATSEASALAQHVGQVVFVVKAERTSRAAVRSALDLLGDHPSIGLVLNGARPQLGSAQFGYYHAKGYYSPTH